MQKEYLLNPLSDEEIIKQVEENKTVRGVVLVDLSEIVDGGIENFFDVLTQKLIGGGSLYDIGYVVVGGFDGSVLIEVSGKPDLTLI